MNYDYQEIEMPTKGVSINKSRTGVPYVYHIGKGYRNEHGKPTSKKILIGKLNPISKKLIPNKRYFELYPDEPIRVQTAADQVQCIQDFGHYYLLDAIANQYQLPRILNNIFGEQSDDILLLAIYTAIEGNVAYYCEDWCENTFTFTQRRLTTQMISRLLQSITEEKKQAFFKAWRYAQAPHEYLAYDVTSISSYSQSHDYMEYGYNRDHESLPQINLAMFYGEESRLPIYYASYPGSIPDKTHFAYMMKEAKRMGMQKTKFVMDGGFYTEKNVDLLLTQQHTFIMGIPSHMKICIKLRKENKSVITKAQYRLQTHNIQAMRFPCYEYRCPTYIHMFYSSEKASLQESNFYQYLDKLEKALKEGETPKGYETYFHCEKKQNDSFEVSRNFDAIDEKLASFGYFFILTSDEALHSSDVISIYRNKDVIEKNFDNLKNAVDAKRLRTHSLQATEGKLFISFLALILRSHLMNVSKTWLHSQSASLDKLLWELRKIKVAKIGHSYLHNPLTKKQKDILALFGLAEKDILDCI